MKACVETCHLWNIRQSVEDRLDRSQIVWLVQWGEWNQVIQVRQNLRSQDGRLSVGCPPMNDAVANT